MRVSIITASLNSASTITSAITSVNSQCYSDIEHVFIDGGSTDDTLKVISNLSIRNKILRSEPDAGIYDALNKGVALATGDIIAFLHSDDFYPRRDVISSIVKSFETNEASVVYGNAVYVDRDNVENILRYWRCGSFQSNALKMGWSPCHPAIFVRSTVYKELGVFSLDFSISADYLFVLKLFSKYGTASYFLDNTVVTMRLGGVSTRHGNTLKKWGQDYKILRLQGFLPIFTLFMKVTRKIFQIRLKSWF